MADTLRPQAVCGPLGLVKKRLGGVVFAALQMDHARIELKKEAAVFAVLVPAFRHDLNRFLTVSGRDQVVDLAPVGAGSASGKQRCRRQEENQFLQKGAVSTHGRDQGLNRLCWITFLIFFSPIQTFRFVSISISSRFT